MNNILKTFSNLITLFFLTILIISCQNKIDEKTKVQNIAELDTIAVKVATIKYNDIKLSKTYTGSLEGEEQAYIVAKISERIIGIKVQIGNYVEKGKVVVELDKVGSTSQYYQAEAGYLNSKKDLDRMRVLYQEGAISQQMFDGAQTAFNIAKANFDASKSLVELTSPISGIVTEINGEAGDLATPGTRIVTIAKINRLKAVFNVGEQDIMSLMVNQPIEVYSELKPELVMNGKIIQISKSADVESRTFEINGLFANSSDKWFKPGMFCRVRLILKIQNSSLTVPSSSLIINGNDKGVFVVSNGKAYFRKLTVGINDDIFTEILSGLKENEKVVTMGMNNLKDGIPVHIVE
jgi:membrane fusion protein, multidrug efflux system